MLVLTRRNGETIVIDYDAEIKIRILGIKKGQVKIGIEAPKRVPVNREEIWEKLKLKNNKNLKNLNEENKE